MKKNTTLNIIATNKTDITNSSRSLRRQVGELESALGSIVNKLEGTGKAEQFYEPFWPGGQYVFMRYGEICACRRDDWWVGLELKNFTSLCAMEKENCESPVKSWYPLHRGLCSYSNNPHEFLSTFDEMYEASTQKFFSRADFYEQEYRVDGNGPEIVAKKKRK
ncbi:unnamed protein product [Arctia plantaginis]|uniref:Uncharacterized protein n=1 Tax=Arctia plantaginis TaxID=874455 RepID=A0A8S1ACA6_ARCPL|nr:unnamed protein product [Arctia plantaginis]CAB3252201.1 unnamed protein product [Arctia plantaginis]